MNVSMIGRITSQHLDDDVFAELWTNAMAEDAPVAAHPHLQECAECRLRFASFSSWLQELRADALAEAAGAIPVERLAAQQAQILRRLETAERPARVIAFPKHPVEATRPASGRRWIAGAAAAAFIAGLGLGQMLNLRELSSAPSTFPADRIADARGASPRVPEVVPARATLTDDEYLAELEEASTPRYEALRAYDAFTPRAADFVTSSSSPRSPR
jgi:hypothetical protein